MRKEAPVMRDFLYLNEAFLTIFADQTGKGLAKSQEEIESEQNEKGNAGLSLDASAGGNIGSTIAGGVEVKAGTTIENARRKRSHENMSKITYVKQRPDDIFNDFESYIGKEYQNKKALKVGGYVRAEYDLNFINFDRIESLFSEKLWKEYTFPSNGSSLESIRRNLPFLKVAIPYKTFLCGENIIVPIENELFLRGEAHQIGFSFEKKATVVGRVKKLIDFKPQNQTKLTETLNEIQNMTFNLMNELGFVEISKNKKLFIVYPIAIFPCSLV
ncbi:MAG: hypothetical protein FWH26_06730 [Oscillospiraceae bacterium]|nr:hypothetical protein [Oscillospiraceae bacterium]